MFPVLVLKTSVGTAYRSRSLFCLHYTNVPHSQFILRNEGIKDFKDNLECKKDNKSNTFFIIVKLFIMEKNLRYDVYAMHLLHIAIACIYHCDYMYIPLPLQVYTFATACIYTINTACISHVRIINYMKACDKCGNFDNRKLYILQIFVVHSFLFNKF